MTDLDKNFRRVVIIIGSIVIISSLGLLGWLTVLMADQPEIDPSAWIVFGFLIMLIFTALRFVLSAVAGGDEGA